MVKTKHWICIALLTLALAPVASADEPGSVADLLGDWLAQMVAEVLGSSTDTSEIGIAIPGGGANSPAGDNSTSGNPGNPGPDQPEIGNLIPVGG
jgi:hypothetical protein